MRPRRAQRFCKNLHSIGLLVESNGVFQRFKAPSTATRSRPGMFPTQQERPSHPIPAPGADPAVARRCRGDVEAAGGHGRQCGGIRHQLVEGKLWSTQKRRRSLHKADSHIGSATHSRHLRATLRGETDAGGLPAKLQRLLEGRSRGAVTGSCSARPGAVNSHRGAVGPT
jgi:hypothetical protein